LFSFFEAVAKLLLAFATGRLGALEIWRKLQKFSETPRLLFSQQRKQTATLRNLMGFATGSVFNPSQTPVI
jgi:hypothetical protein